jgi:hypothetical protein
MDDYDLPNEIPQDLHLGAAVVKPFSKKSWAEEYGPKPPGPFIRTLDVLFVLLTLSTAYLITKVWIWLFTTSVL